ncbi:MAG: DNA recombination protein RmuC [Spirochaetes bacterium]|nr:DNA recombination protein RmuC [Spirochaetota bacterium]
MEYTIFILFFIVILLLFITFKLFFTQSNSNNELSLQLLDLKNQLTEIKTKQIEAHSIAIENQQKHLTQLIATVNEILTSTQKNITEQLHHTGSVINTIHTKLGSLEQTVQHIQEIGKDIASLQDILAAPKLRGNLGEYLLEELLKQILPAKNFQMQYSFKNGTTVDAIIRLGEHLIPVDSKFPLESFQRIIEAKLDTDKTKFKKQFIQTVKQRIDEISKKYINPNEGTYDFALMYIPAENVFYETIVNDTVSNKEYEIFNYALEHRVIPVSPNSFYAYLMAIAYGLKGLQIEQKAKEILQHLATIQNQLRLFETEYSKTGRHIRNALSSYESSQRLVDRINEKIANITGESVELLPEVEND